MGHYMARKREQSGVELVTNYLEALALPGMDLANTVLLPFSSVSQIPGSGLSLSSAC